MKNIKNQNRIFTEGSYDMILIYWVLTIRFKILINGYYKLSRKTLHPKRAVGNVFSFNKHITLWSCCGCLFIQSQT